MLEHAWQGNLESSFSAKVGYSNPAAALSQIQFSGWLRPLQWEEGGIGQSVHHCKSQSFCRVVAVV